jgi:hypothetical protein
VPRPASRPTFTFTDLVARAGLWAWAWRIEIVLVLTMVTVRNLIADHDGLLGADVTVTVAISLLLVPRATRSRLTQLLLGAERSRRWKSSLATVIPLPATPRVLAGGTDWTGEWAGVRVAPGTTVTDLIDQAETLAACFDVDQVRVRRSERSAAYGLIRTLRIDPLDTAASPWPWIAAAWTELWRPIPVGIDEDGRPVAVTLPEHNLLIGGEPGSGKSVALSQLVAAAALDPKTNLYLLDGKLVELAAWAPVATATAGTAISEATDVLHHLQVLMDQRYLQLLGARLRKIPAGTGLHMVVIDELAHYLTWPDKKPRDAFTDTLRDLVSRGRAAGIVVIAATQKPASDIVPTSLRDLFGYRWALRCTTNAASDTILGTGWATTGTSAATIKPSARGVGWLLHESGTPARLRAHQLTDTDIQTIAARATQLRRQHDAAPSTAGGRDSTDGLADLRPGPVQPAVDRSDEGGREAHHGGA